MNYEDSPSPAETDDNRGGALQSFRHVYGGATAVCASGDTASSPPAPPDARKSRPRFVDDIERCFRGSPEAIEPGGGDYVPDSGLAGLSAQAQSHFLRSRAR